MSIICKFLTDFSKCKNDLLSDPGINLRKRIKLTQNYYREAEADVTKTNLKGKPKFIHVTDKIFTEFNDLYQNNKKFRNYFLCCLLHSFVVKLSGNTNAQYAVVALNFSIALAADGNKKAYEFVAINICLMSLQHDRRVFESSRLPPFIHLTFNGTTQKKCNHFHNICKATGSTYTPIDFTVVVDATVVVKSWQILQSHGAFVDGEYPNHFWDIKNKSDEETVALMKEFVDGKHCLQTDEVKVAVITMHVVPQGFGPYFTLFGRTHTINEINTF